MRTSLLASLSALAVQALGGLFVIHCGPIGATGSTVLPVDAGAADVEESGSVTQSGLSSPEAGVDAAVGGVDGEAGPPPTGLHVEGNHFVDNGKTVRLLGVDHAGTEYMCVHGGAVFEGPSDTSFVGPMMQWHINTVRVPLNEDCWLGINGVAIDVGGSAYQQAITGFVQMLRTSGLYVILDLHWNAPGATLATTQQPMPDADHAEDFWISVAGTFKGDMGVVFDLYNEPYPDKGTSNPGGCLLDGCELSDWSGFTGPAMAVGMQQLVDDVRGKAGASNVILVGGWSYASQLGSWLTYAPKDPRSNLAASFHTYNFTGCSDAACWNSTVKPVASKVPVVTGELGENDCGQGYVDSYFAWADPLGVSYLGWAWNAQNCSSFPALITDYTGTPTALGQGFLTHLPTQ
jgi:hypothetical protein